MVVGIDPGLSGAVAFIGSDGPEVYDMPTLRVGKGARRRLDLVGLCDLLRSMAVSRNLVRFIIETQQPMPGQGVTSTFSTGYGLGAIEGILTALGVSWRGVRPQEWQRVILAGAAGEGKDRALMVAERLFPGAELRGPRGGALDGRADALCIAEYGRRQG